MAMEGPTNPHQSNVPEVFAGKKRGNDKNIYDTTVLITS